MRANSLALRLFVSATAWAVVILLITGIVLSSLYRQAVETTEESTADRALMQLRLTEAEAHAGLPITTPKP